MSRNWGQGSVYPSPDGAGWVASIDIRSADGRRQRRKRRASTKTEAQRHLRAMRAELDQHGELPNAQRIVKASIEDYLRRRQGEQIEHKTFEEDQRAAAMISQGLGTFRIASLTVTDCDRFLESAADGKFGGPLARPQLRRLRRNLIRVIANDLRRGLVARNVAELSVIPDESPGLVPRREARALPYDELQRLLAAATGATAVLIDLSGRNGLRPAEARALRWSRVNLDQLTLRVDAQMNRRNEVAKAKTRRSQRTIRIDSRTATLLSEWSDHQSAAGAYAGPAWSGNVDDLVATTERGTAINQRNVHRSLVQASRRAGIAPVSGYDLRHTAITLQVERRRPLHLIADWAGTSERMIMDVYRHKIEDVSDLGPIDE
jgi:integrase